MKKDISPAEEMNVLLLSQGYTQKEVANMRNRSTRTIGNQVDHFYKKTGCRNLADLTRFVVKRYSGIPVEDIIINALHDLTLIIFGAFLFYIISRPEGRDYVIGGFDGIFEIVRDHSKRMFNAPVGTF